jgi:hypothetical protein
MTFARETMRTLIMAGRAILAGILWVIGATAVFIGFLFAAKPIFEPQPNSQGEVAHFLTDIILVFILTIVAVVALARANRKSCVWGRTFATSW